ncbi:AI-2E family transporter [Pigmentiphaga sp.]|uniref:AI-2E family transporter n=1 Tax=Pigmentiphaga sp. TaxID=1977564 RepID=UPI00128D45D2|nr:AI-2E family transporter [Pigmentiphaga sp.]MPS26769.1 AI-2E family transporter [Alcaligenaceae bacterium SAGV5]MPS53795.1 AI-2E family transporter [Alcaligenaceae bacterium SAGV3]MPT59893.1 AI-2E family transporter [Alcaligenaceae bacterium]
MSQTSLQYRTFLLLLVLVTLAFGWLLWPFFGAVFWGAILAIIFFPLQRRLVTAFGGRNNLAALATLAVCVLIVIIPVSLIAGTIVSQGAGFYEQIKAGDIDFRGYLDQAMAALPPTARSLLEKFGMVDVNSIQSKLAEVATRGSQFFATQALNIGQNTFQFVISLGVMLYLLFFLLRDGPDLSARIRQALPLTEEHKRHLFRKFIAVVRATVKGNIVVAITQGMLGGLIFWILGIKGALLWSVVMAFLSLLPAVGAGLIWGPVAIYFILSGDTLQGIILTLYGILVIGLVDNVLRPILVGKDTRMPDYVILISTLGGMALFGINGFVIGPLIAALFMAVWDLFSSMDDPPPADET